MPLTPTETNLLLFLETCAVDHMGGVDVAHMNAEDMEIARRWDTERFVRFGHLPIGDHKNVAGYCRTHYVVLGDAAWQEVGAARKARAERCWARAPFRQDLEP